MRRVLGQITVAGGRIAVVDAGLLGSWTPSHTSQAAHAATSGSALFDFGGPNAAIVGSIPNGTLQVSAMTAEDGNTWRWVDLICDADRVVANAREVGGLIVDEARFMITDLDALSAWKHEESMDGRADVAFWGRDADAVAAEMGAAKLPEGVWGWADLPVADAEERYRTLDAARGQGRKFMADFRPHSHHYSAMTLVRSSPVGVGHVQVAGATVFVASTPYGDGVFPVLVLEDEARRPLGVRIVFSGESGPEVSGVGETLGAAGMPPDPMSSAKTALAGAAAGAATGFATRMAVGQAKKILPKFLWPLLPGQRGTVGGNLANQASRRFWGAVSGCIFTIFFFGVVGCILGTTALYVVYAVMTS